MPFQHQRTNEPVFAKGEATIDEDADHGDDSLEKNPFHTDTHLRRPSPSAFSNDVCTNLLLCFDWWIRLVGRRVEGSMRAVKKGVNVGAGRGEVHYTKKHD
jgi:hypothetical protein